MARWILASLACASASRRLRRQGRGQQPDGLRRTVPRPCERRQRRLPPPRPAASTASAPINTSPTWSPSVRTAPAPTAIRRAQQYIIGKLQELRLPRGSGRLSHAHAHRQRGHEKHRRQDSRSEPRHPHLHHALRQQAPPEFRRRRRRRLLHRRDARICAPGLRAQKRHDRLDRLLRRRRGLQLRLERSRQHLRQPRTRRAHGAFRRSAARESWSWPTWSASQICTSSANRIRLRGSRTWSGPRPRSSAIGNVFVNDSDPDRGRPRAVPASARFPRWTSSTAATTRSLTGTPPQDTLDKVSPQKPRHRGPRPDRHASRARTEIPHRSPDMPQSWTSVRHDLSASAFAPQRDVLRVCVRVAGSSSPRAGSGSCARSANTPASIC